MRALSGTGAGLEEQPAALPWVQARTFGAAKHLFRGVNSTFHFSQLRPQYVLPTSSSTREKLLSIHSSLHPKTGDDPCLFGFVVLL